MVMKQILTYIEEHLEDKITTIELADFAGYSEYHFIRLFKKYTNMTVTEYVIKRKLIKASEEIIEGNKIIDVAFKYGWQSHSSFTKAFNREFGFKPSLLRAVTLEINNLDGAMEASEWRNSMNHVFLESTNVGKSKEELFDILIKKLNENGQEYSRKDLDTVYEVACKVYSGMTRYSGEEYVTHTINVAIVLAELGADSNIVLAGMLCDNKGNIGLDEIKEQLSQGIYQIVENVYNSSKELINENDDVILIKIAERLHNMRTIEFIDEDKRKEKALDTINLYMPIVRKMGNQKLIDELNDLSMKYYVK